MPLILRKDLPCIPSLRYEGIDIHDKAPSDVTPLRLLLINLMPQKEESEMEYFRMLAHPTLWVEITLVKMSGQTYKTTPQSYVDTYYEDVARIMDSGEDYDGLVVTGAPVEKLPFEAVRYWPQLVEIFHWAESHVNAFLSICWGAQAALKALYGVEKHDLPEKMFGIFRQDIHAPSSPLFSGLYDRFNMPHSRHTEVYVKDILAHPKLTLLASSPLSGASVIQAEGGRQLFVTGHLEYMPGRLAFEYERDLKKHLPIHVPYNYFENDDPKGPVRDSWRDGARRFYHNWLENYVNRA